MKLKARYRQVVLDGGKTMSLGSVVDDLLGLRDETPYLLYLFLRYGPLFPHPDKPARPTREEIDAAGDTLAGLGHPRELAEGWAVFTQVFRSFVAAPADPDVIRAAIRAHHARASGKAPLPRWQEVRNLFQGAAEAASQGRFAPALADHLARVRWLPGGAVELDDLYALGAWSLNELLGRGPIQLATCPICKHPWLPDRDAKHCRRPAPGRLASCRAVAKHDRFVHSHRDYHRERKKLYERVRRGTMSGDTYAHWLAANTTDSWTPFDQWNQAETQDNRKEDT